MTASSIQITQGSGTRLATNSYTEGGNTVHDEKMISGMPYWASYSVSAAFVSTATLNDHILQIMAGSSLNVYIHEIVITQDQVATTAAFEPFRVLRLTTAGTGGTSQTLSPHDLGDSAAGATAMTLPTAKGTEAGLIDTQSAYMTQTPGAGGTAFGSLYEWRVGASGLFKPIRISSGTTNGLAIKLLRAVAGATVNVRVTLTEASF